MQLFLVAQALVDSPLVIYNTLSNDAILTPLIGTYTFTDSSTQPSISILSPGEELPSLKYVNGLEIVIHDIGVTSTQPYLTGYADPILIWKIYLIAWPGATGDTINEAVKRIASRFGNVWTIEISARGGPLGALAQSMIMVRSTSVVIPEA